MLLFSLSYILARRDQCPLIAVYVNFKLKVHSFTASTTVIIVLRTVFINLNDYEKNCIFGCFVATVLRCFS